MEYVSYLFSYYYSFVGLTVNSGMWQDLEDLFYAILMVFVVHTDWKRFGHYRVDDSILRLES